MAQTDLLGVLAGGGIGLVAGLGGVFLGQWLTSRRELRAAHVQGLREVCAELEKRRRLTLDIAQTVNLGLRGKSPEEFDHQAFDMPGWKDLTLALQERPWLFPVSAHLPTAQPYFEDLDRLIFRLLDVHESPQGEIAVAINQQVHVIEEMLRTSLRKHFGGG